MEEVKGKEPREALLELLFVILLSITAVATAWASWQGALHGSQQDQKYTNATRLTAEGNSIYNEATNYMSQDMNIWNQIVGLHIDIAFATDKQDADEIEKLEYKLDQIMTDNVGDEFEEAIDWADAQDEYASPFENEDFAASYFADSNAKFDEAEEMMEAGNSNNTYGDNQGLVTVIYAVVLFLLGIGSIFKAGRAKVVLLAMSVVGFVGATAVMLTVPIVLP
jgi:hypothetical protein